MKRPLPARLGPIAAVLLCSCVDPAARIAAELQAAGFAPAYARCVGERMEDRLTVSQLLRLRDAVRGYRAHHRGGRLDFAGLLAAVQEVGDRQIALETIGAGLHCGLRQ